MTPPVWKLESTFKMKRSEKQKIIAQRRVRLAEENCLAKAIYFEARSESELGQLAVAKVILNRVKDPQLSQDASAASSIRAPIAAIPASSPSPATACRRGEEQGRPGRSLQAHRPEGALPAIRPFASSVRPPTIMPIMCRPQWAYADEASSSRSAATSSTPTPDEFLAIDSHQGASAAPFSFWRRRPVSCAGNGRVDHGVQGNRRHRLDLVRRQVASKAIRRSWGR